MSNFTSQSLILSTYLSLFSSYIGHIAHNYKIIDHDIIYNSYSLLISLESYHPLSIILYNESMRLYKYNRKGISTFIYCIIKYINIYNKLEKLYSKLSIFKYIDIYYYNIKILLYNISFPLNLLINTKNPINLRSILSSLLYTYKSSYNITDNAFDCIEYIINKSSSISSTNHIDANILIDFDKFATYFISFNKKLQFDALYQSEKYNVLNGLIITAHIKYDLYIPTIQDVSDDIGKLLIEYNIKQIIFANDVNRNYHSWLRSLDIIPITNVPLRDINTMTLEFGLSKLSTLEDLFIYSTAPSLKIFLPCKSSFYNLESELFIHIKPVIGLPRYIYTVVIFSVHPLIRSCAEELFKNCFFSLKSLFHKGISAGNSKLLIGGGVPELILICALTRNKCNENFHFYRVYEEFSNCFVDWIMTCLSNRGFNFNESSDILSTFINFYTDYFSTHHSFLWNNLCSNMYKDSDEVINIEFGPILFDAVANSRLPSPLKFSTYYLFNSPKMTKYSQQEINNSEESAIFIDTYKSKLDCWLSSIGTARLIFNCTNLLSVRDGKTYFLNTKTNTQDIL